MILINKQWCEVRDLDDIVTIIKEQFNYDLSDKRDWMEGVRYDEYLFWYRIYRTT